MPLLLLLLLLPVALLVLMPLALVRYRAGSARRPARPWVATLALVAVSISTMIFLVAAAVTNLWIPKAFGAAAAGLGVGCVLGGLGLMLTRWEATPGAFYYTPNRWVILTITLVVSARVLYGLWRSWAVAQAGLSSAALVTAFSVPDSLAAGATVSATNSLTVLDCAGESACGKRAPCVCCERSVRSFAEWKTERDPVCGADASHHAVDRGAGV